MKAKTQQFTRRKKSLFKRANQLARLCKADLALIIYKNNRYYMYRSIEQQCWPPSVADIEKSYPLPVMLTPENFKESDGEGIAYLEERDSEKADAGHKAGSGVADPKVGGNE